MRLMFHELDKTERMMRMVSLTVSGTKFYRRGDDLWVHEPAYQMQDTPGQDCAFHIIDPS